MRENKFRAWDGQIMIENVCPVFQDDGRVFLIAQPGYNKIQTIQNGFYIETELWMTREYKVMQFTGLKDKNGEDIYEGDVVKIHNYKTTWKGSEPPFDWRIFGIKWNKYLWSFENSVIYMPMSHYNNTILEDYDIEIIGNIYENPELLK